MDFFRSVQGVEVEAVGDDTGNEFAEEIVQRREEGRRISDEYRVAPGSTEGENKQSFTRDRRGKKAARSSQG